MSDVTPESLKGWKPGNIPQPISKKISSLRGAMLRWIVIRGLAWLGGLILLTLAVDFLIDYLAHMDFAQRCIMGILVVGTWCFGIYRFFFQPLKKRPTDDALILSVEKELESRNNPLINSIQLSRVKDHQKVGQSTTMAQHVIGQGIEEAEKLDFHKILNHSASMKHLAAVVICILAFAGIGFGITGTVYGKLWFQRNVLLQNVKYPSSTILHVKGVKDGVLVIPYGEDFKVTVNVDPESKVKDVDVFLNFLNQSSSGRQKFSNSEKEPMTHRTVLRSVKSELKFQVSGGDFYSDPIQVKLVKPPGFKNLTLQLTPPVYCQLPAEQLLLSSDSFNVLVGSKIEIIAEADKPGSTISLNAGSKKIEFQSAGDQANPELVKAVLEGENLATGNYEFELVDKQGISSSNVVKFSLNVTEDRAPAVRTRVAGVSRKIVAKAMIPIASSIKDEYGVKESWTELRFGDLGQEPRNLIVIPTKDLEESEKGRVHSGLEIVDLKPLGLNTGTVIRLRLAGKDFQPDPVGYKKVITHLAKKAEEGKTTAESKQKSVQHSGIGFGKSMDLQIVSESELRSDLLRRETEQTTSFKRLIKQQRKVLTDLKILKVAKISKSENEEAFISRKQQAGSIAIRSQRQVETLIVQTIDRFDSFLKEIHYNRLDDGISELSGSTGVTLSSRINEKIVQPLQEVNEKLMPKIQRHLEVVSRNYGSQQELADSIDKVTSIQTEAIAKLEAILAAMEQSQTFQEIVNQVMAMKLEEQKVREKAKKRKEENSGIGEIFK